MHAKEKANESPSIEFFYMYTNVYIFSRQLCRDCVPCDFVFQEVYNSSILLVLYCTVHEQLGYNP